jgi:predicted kinase
MDLIIFVGLQGSGKSTFFQQRFAATHTLVSKDRLHTTKHKQRRQMQLLEEALHAGQNVVVDNTNPTPEDRAPLIAAGRGYGARIIGYYFPARLGEVLARNRAREGLARVPDIAIFATAKRLRAPTLAEGFDELFEVHTSDENGFLVAATDGHPGAIDGA